MTTTTSADDRVDVRNALFHSLSSARRRFVLGFLLERAPEWTTVDSLADHLVAEERNTDDDVVTSVETAHITLIHSSLPALEDGGLIEWDRANGAIRLGSDPVLDDPTIRRILSQFDRDRATYPPAEADTVFDAFADSRRRTIVSELGRWNRPVSCAFLARAVVAREVDGTGESVERVLTTLVHTHLPLLSEAGLIEYDHESGRVSYVGHPQVRGEWFEPELQHSVPFAG